MICIIMYYDMHNFVLLIAFIVLLMHFIMQIVTLFVTLELDVI